MHMGYDPSRDVDAVGALVELFKHIVESYVVFAVRAAAVVDDEAAVLKGDYVAHTEVSG